MTSTFSWRERREEEENWKLMGERDKKGRQRVGRRLEVVGRYEKKKDSVRGRRGKI